MQNGDVAMLILLDGPERGQRWPLTADHLIIGRDDSKADIVIPDRRVSREHAEIVLRNGNYFIRDLGSKNGTYLNGKRLEAASILQDGDEIHVGMTAQFFFVGAGNTVPLVLGGAAEPGLRINDETKQVWIDGQELKPPLSQAQLRLLQLLYHANGAVCSRDEIVAAVWPDEAEEGVTEQAIDALVRRLRERLSELGRERCFVVTVRGHGFRLENRW